MAQAILRDVERRAKPQRQLELPDLRGLKRGQGVQRRDREIRASSTRSPRCRGAVFAWCRRLSVVRHRRPF